MKLYMPPTPVQEHDAIRQVFDLYAEGAKSGSIEPLKAAFHPGATIYGFVGPDLFGGSIEHFYEWHTGNGPATDVEIRVTAIDLAASIATARVEIDNWTGHRFTDQFTLLKTDGAWKIISKVFHLHED